MRLLVQWWLRGPAGSVVRVSGVAVSFVSAGTQAHWQLIEKRQGREIPCEQIPGFEPTQAAPAAAVPGTGGIKGKRPSKKDKLRAAGLLPPLDQSSE